MRRGYYEGERVWKVEDGWMGNKFGRYEYGPYGVGGALEELEVLGMMSLVAKKRTNHAHYDMETTVHAVVSTAYGADAASAFIPNGLLR